MCNQNTENSCFVTRSMNLYQQTLKIVSSFNGISLCILSAHHVLDWLMMSHVNLRNSAIYILRIFRFNFPFLTGGSSHRIIFTFLPSEWIRKTAHSYYFIWRFTTVISLNRLSLMVSLTFHPFIRFKILQINTSTLKLLESNS